MRHGTWLTTGGKSPTNGVTVTVTASCVLEEGSRGALCSPCLGLGDRRGHGQERAQALVMDPGVDSGLEVTLGPQSRETLGQRSDLTWRGGALTLDGAAEGRPGARAVTQRDAGTRPSSTQHRSCLPRRRGTGLHPTARCTEQVQEDSLVPF